MYIACSCYCISALPELPDSITLGQAVGTHSYVVPCSVYFLGLVNTPV
jgi:hypothetical protein